MSTPAQKANLARIRDNQRRSRARRREYIQELEQRLRAFELSGVEASAEVQMAARRVAEENRQLRELLNKHGFGDDYIARYLQMGAATLPDARTQRFTAGDPGSSVQSLQHLIAPRKPIGIETGVAFPVPSQVAREMSATSASSGSSSTWDTQNPALPAYGQHPQLMPIGSASLLHQPGEHHQYASQMFPDGRLPTRSAPEAFANIPSTGALLHEVPSQAASAQSMAADHQDAINYSAPLSQYQIPAHRDFPLPGPYY